MRIISVNEAQAEVSEIIGKKPEGRLTAADAKLADGIAQGFNPIRAKLGDYKRASEKARPDPVEMDTLVRGHLSKLASGLTVHLMRLESQNAEMAVDLASMNDIANMVYDPELSPVVIDRVAKEISPMAGYILDAARVLHIVQGCVSQETVKVRAARTRI